MIHTQKTREILQQLLNRTVDSSFENEFFFFSPQQKSCVAHSLKSITGLNVMKIKIRSDEFSSTGHFRYDKSTLSYLKILLY